MPNLIVGFDPAGADSLTIAETRIEDGLLIVDYPPAWPDEMGINLTNETLPLFWKLRNNPYDEETADKLQALGINPDFVRADSPLVGMAKELKELQDDYGAPIYRKPQTFKPTRISNQ